MAIATNPQLEKVGSHSVSLEYERGGDVSREECYPELTATWRGDEITVEMEANRYRFADGDWSDWRVFVRRAVFAGTHNVVTDTARRALSDVCAPLVLSWLNSPAYDGSRAQAFAYMLRRQIRQETYNADNVAEILAKYQHELPEYDVETLGEAVEHLRSLLQILDSRPLVSA